MSSKRGPKKGPRQSNNFVYIYIYIWVCANRVDKTRRVDSIPTVENELLCPIVSLTWLRCGKTFALSNPTKPTLKQVGWTTRAGQSEAHSRGIPTPSATGGQWPKRRHQRQPSSGTSSLSLSLAGLTTRSPRQNCDWTSRVSLRCCNATSRQFCSNMTLVRMPTLYAWTTSVQQERPNKHGSQRVAASAPRQQVHLLCIKTRHEPVVAVQLCRPVLAHTHKHPQATSG